MTKHLPTAVALYLLTVLGCGANTKSVFPMDSALEQEATLPDVTVETASLADPSGQKTPGARSGLANDVGKRKLVFRADVDLVVEQFDPLPEQIEAAVKRFGGFISASNITGLPGQPRSGRWTIRVPVDQYQACLAAVSQLGEVRSINSTSADVTADYYDIEARIRNQQQEEERLLKLLTDAAGKLEEILAVERELARVRGEIEQAQGRLRVLRDVTELTTVVVRVTEIKNYVPEQAPTYATRVRRALASSTIAFVSTAQSLSLVAVALVPWLPVPLALVMIVILVRWLRRRRHVRSDRQ